MLEQKTILITGASSGVGRETALLLARRGARLVLCDLDAVGGAALVDALRAQGGRADFVRTDVTDGAQVAELMAAVERDHGPLSTAVNNAGIDHPAGRLADYGEDVFDRVVAVNLKGVWLCMKHELLHMLAHGGGHIVNVASVAGLRAAPSLALYAASKHGVVGLTRSAALEYARDNIRVNAVCPSVLRTPMAERHAQTEPDVLARMIRANPMKRMGEAGEVAAAIAWLCSDESSFVNGATLAVDGGLTA